MAQHQFLSDGWFAAVEGLPPVMDADTGLILNVVVTGGPDGDRQAHVAHGRILRGPGAGAHALLTLPFALAYSVFLGGYASVMLLMQAIISGRASLSGDFAALKSLIDDDGFALRGFPASLAGVTAAPPPGLLPTAADYRAAARKMVLDKISRLKLDAYAKELDVNGYTILPPEVTGMGTRIDKVLDKVLERIEARTGIRHDMATGETLRNRHWPSLYYFLFEDPLFQELVLNEPALALTEYLLGTDCVINECQVFAKGPMDPSAHKLQFGLHTDLGAIWPDPYPVEALFCNCNWLLTDYSAEDGGTVFIPGSHTLCRAPVGAEGEDRFVAPKARKGSLMVWHGNTWHGSHPRSKPGIRIGLQFGFGRPGLGRLEPFQFDVTEEILTRNPPRFAELMGLANIAGYRDEGSFRRSIRLAEQAVRCAANRAKETPAVAAQ